jgi:hypothetical protein
MNRQQRRSTLAQSNTLCIGMDGHKDAIAVAYEAQHHGAEILSLGTLGARPGAIDPLIRKMPAKAQHLIFVSEAGPWGSWLYRSLTQKGYDCWGGPSRIPNNPEIASTLTAEMLSQL